MEYIDYKSLKESYSISELCDLFGMNKLDLKLKCEEYGIKPSRNQVGVGVVSRFDVCRLHNRLYYRLFLESSTVKEKEPSSCSAMFFRLSSERAPYFWMSGTAIKLSVSMLVAGRFWVVRSCLSFRRTPLWASAKG